jgi:hypothetical protein
VTSFRGEPGDTFYNGTDAALYQFLASLGNTCGRCMQNHTRIATWWPIPLHPNCRCEQVMIAPGASAPLAFKSVREIFRELAPAERKEAVGASNARLLTSGRVTWDDVVLPDRVRDLAEVVALKHLTLAQLVAAGVLASVAKQALERARESAAAHKVRQERERDETVDRARASQDAIVDALDVEPMHQGLQAAGVIHGAALASAVALWPGSGP